MSLKIDRDPVRSLNDADVGPDNRSFYDRLLRAVGRDPSYSVVSAFQVLVCGAVFAAVGSYLAWRIVVDGSIRLTTVAAILLLVAGLYGYVSFVVFRDIMSDPDCGFEVLTSETSVEDSYSLTHLPLRR